MGIWYGICPGLHAHMWGSSGDLFIKILHLFQSLMKTEKFITTHTMFLQHLILQIPLGSRWSGRILYGDLPKVLSHRWGIVHMELDKSPPLATCICPRWGWCMGLAIDC